MNSKILRNNWSNNAQISVSPISAFICVHLRLIKLIFRQEIPHNLGITLATRPLCI